MFRRTRPLRDPVTIQLDGSPVQAERGEPIAAALLASDITILARSPKLHRPRSASCFRGGCDGCLMRVGGEPNVMTCLTQANEGVEIESQNVVGSRKADLLRVTDWFFPKGIDHHHFMAGVPALGSIMQSFARKIAGLGRLPSEPSEPRPARLVEADVVIVGAGLAGLVVASRLEETGARVAVVDDKLEIGGSLVALPDQADLLASLRPSGDLLFTRVTAAGVYLGDLLVATHEEAVVLRAKHKVIATGAHDGVLAFPGNDLPGVISARALCYLHTIGIEPDGPVVLVGDGFWSNELERRLGDRVSRVDPSSLSGAEGTAGVKRVVVRDGEKGRHIKACVLAISAPCAPAFELAEQAGARIEYIPNRGYAVVCNDEGACCEGVWAVGECTGVDFDPEAITRAAERVASAISRR